MTIVTIAEIITFVTANYPGLVVGQNWGERALFYNPDHALPKGVYLLTFKDNDGPNDAASNVSRPGVYRLNLGITKATFRAMFGSIPPRPAVGGAVATGHDFQRLDTVMPHPVYGWMAWIAVLNPSTRTFEQLKPLIAEGYDLAVKRYAGRAKTRR